MKYEKEGVKELESIDSEWRHYMAEGYRKIAEEIRKDKINGFESLNAAENKLWEGRPPSEEDRVKRLWDLLQKDTKLPQNDDPDRIALLIGTGAGLLTTVIGFALWYRRVQRPLDEIMRYDLEERRLKAQRGTNRDGA